jgi:hypothetical protein
MGMTTMTKTTSLALANCVSLAMAGLAQAQGAPAAEPSDQARLEQLERIVAEQKAALGDLREALLQQDRSMSELRRMLAEEQLEDVRGTGLQDTALPPQPSPVAQLEPAQDAPQQQPVGRAPEEDTRPPEVAQIFEQPGVLTPQGKFVLEPSLQFGYSANDRVALVGYTIIPAILIGLIDVRQVKTTSATLALTGRYGLGKRFELEARVPYTYINGDTVSREIFTGSAQDEVFNASGHGLGDVEMTARYQFQHDRPDRPYYVGWLRYKSRTGKDLFEVVTDCVTRCVANATGTGLPLELPTGSGFASLQSGVTWLYASDPVVFFGSFSYLYNFPREDVSRTVLSGAPEPFSPTTTEFIGEVEAGDIFGFNVGVGLALNEKAAISVGYDQSVVGKTKQNGVDVPGSVRVILGTMSLGGSYRFNDRVNLNVALGVGVTRDTPDMSLTVRVPVTF